MRSMTYMMVKKIDLLRHYGSHYQGHLTKQLPKTFSVKNLPPRGTMFARLLISDVDCIGSKFGARNAEDSRQNFNAIFLTSSDRNTCNVNAEADFDFIKEEVGSILYFFHHKFLDEDHLLARVEWGSSIIEQSRLHYRYFEKFIHKGFISVSAISRLVGVAKLKAGKFIIFDKNWGLDDPDS